MPNMNSMVFCCFIFASPPSPWFVLFCFVSPELTWNRLWSFCPTTQPNEQKGLQQNSDDGFFNTSSFCTVTHMDWKREKTLILSPHVTLGLHSTFRYFLLHTNHDPSEKMSCAHAIHSKTEIGKTSLVCGRSFSKRMWFKILPLSSSCHSAWP